MRRILTVALFLSLLFLTACSGKTANNQSGTTSKELVVVDYGGAMSEAQKKSKYEPFEKENDVKITIVSPTDVGKLKAMVEGGNVEWDAVVADSDIALRLENEGLLEDLDFDIIDKSGFRPELVTTSSIGNELYFTNIAYNTDVFSEDNHPKTWKEFWDTEKFPGARSLHKSPMGTLEIALLADGVSPDELYPLDVERALKSLDKIKSEVKVWWDAGAQPPQSLATKEVVLAAAWNGRISSAQSGGAHIANEFNEALAMADSWIIPKGAPNKDLAQKFISFVSEPEQQAEYSKLIDYAPPNEKALDLLPEELKENIGRSSKDAETQITVNIEYWAKNFEEVNEKFNNWLLSN